MSHGVHQRSGPVDDRIWGPARQLAERAAVLRAAAAALSVRVGTMRWSSPAADLARSEVAELVSALHRAAERYDQYAARWAAAARRPQ